MMESSGNESNPEEKVGEGGSVRTPSGGKGQNAGGTVSSVAKTLAAGSEDSEGFSKLIQMSDGGGYRKTGSYADSRGSDHSTDKNSASVQTNDGHEVLLGHIFKHTDDNEDDWLDSQMSDGYYSKKELAKLAPLIKADIEIIKANRKQLGDKLSDQVTKWHTATPPRILGQGTFGRVLEAIDDTSGEIIAVKETTRSRASRSKSIQALQKEMSMLKLLRHHNIVEYRGVQVATSSASDRDKAEDEVLLFLMEYCPNGSISDVLEEFGALGDDVTRKYTSQILCGLDYLHRLCVAHRDIKCANCLLSVGGVVKLADFGSSRHLADCGNSIQGTALYMAPEVIKGGRVGRQADVWAVGCCVVEMLGNSMPLEGKFSNDFALMYRISKTKVSPKAPDDVTGDAKDFVEQCFQILPKNRPSAFHLFHNHPYVANKYPDAQVNNFTPMAGFGNRPQMKRSDSFVQLSEDHDELGLELGACARTLNDQIEREKEKNKALPWTHAKSHGSSSAGSSDNKRLGEALMQRQNSTKANPGGEPTNSKEGRTVNLHFNDDLRSTWKSAADQEKKNKKAEPLKETKPIYGKMAEGNIGRLQTRTGFLFVRFEDEEVENDYIVYFKRRALSFMQERRALAPCFVFGLYLTSFLLRDVSKPEAIAVSLKIVSWTLLAAFQCLPLVEGEDTFDIFVWVVFLYKCVSIVTVWDHDLFYHVFEMAVVTGLSGYFSQVYHHIVWILIYVSMVGINFVHNLALDAIAATDKKFAAEVAAQNATVYGPRIGIIKKLPMSSVYDALHDFLVSGDKKELWIYMALAIVSVLVVHQMHHESRMKYAMGFHVRHL